MNLTALRAEFLARGEDFLDSGTTTRQDMFINMGYTRINEASEAWPWLFADASGAAPLTIADLRSVLAVVDSNNRRVLHRIERSTILELDPTFANTGNATHWYRDADTVLNVWPASGTTISVRYLKVPPALSSGTDTPVIPMRYHPLIVDAAMVEAFKDSEDYSELQGLEQVFQSRLAEMKRAVLDSGTDAIQPLVSGWLGTY